MNFIASMSFVEESIDALVSSNYFSFFAADVKIAL